MSQRIGWLVVLVVSIGCSRPTEEQPSSDAGADVGALDSTSLDSAFSLPDTATSTDTASDTFVSIDTAVAPAVDAGAPVVQLQGSFVGAGAVISASGKTLTGRLAGAGGAASDGGVVLNGSLE